MKTGGQNGVSGSEKNSFLSCQDLGTDKSMTVFIPQRYGSSQKCEKTERATYLTAYRSKKIMINYSICYYSEHPKPGNFIDSIPNE